jgi:hypothetical protein
MRISHDRSGLSAQKTKAGAPSQYVEALPNKASQRIAAQMRRPLNADLGAERGELIVVVFQFVVEFTIGVPSDVPIDWPSNVSPHRKSLACSTSQLQ